MSDSSGTTTKEICKEITNTDGKKTSVTEKTFIDKKGNKKIEKVEDLGDGNIHKVITDGLTGHVDKDINYLK